MAVGAGASELAAAGCLATTSAKLRGLLGGITVDDDDDVSVLSNETPPNIGLYEVAAVTATGLAVADMTVLDEETCCDDAGAG